MTGMEQTQRTETTPEKIVRLSELAREILDSIRNRNISHLAAFYRCSPGDLIEILLSDTTHEQKLTALLASKKRSGHGEH
jgi:DNA-binding Xre family transcriptional regulator